MGEDHFFNSLFNVMWNMETDIFTEQDRTLALLADMVPSCKKQRKRLSAMYECGSMDCIEKAVADKSRYQEYLNKAVKLLETELNMSREKAVFSVNQIVELWDGDLDPVDLTKDKPEKAEETHEEQPQEEKKEPQQENPQNKQEESPEEEPPQDIQTPTQSEVQTTPDENTKTQQENKPKLEKDGEEKMAEEQKQEVQDEKPQETPAEAPAEEKAPEAESPPPPPKDPVLKKIAEMWCKSDCEDGRPAMITCPVGWLMFLICTVLGAFMVYDIPLGDKFTAPTFVMIFSSLCAKRFYKYQSAGHFSAYIAAFYSAALIRVVWIGKGYPPVYSVPLVLAALAVFSSGRMGNFLDTSKRSSFWAYTIIFILSAAVTFGAYAILNIKL